MFTKVCIENFEGILNRIEFDFIAQSRKKKSRYLCIKLMMEFILINL